MKNILKNGLEGRDQLDSSSTDYHYNDKWSDDNIKNGICCSISFPNYRMFYKYRDEAEAPHHKWAVIVLDPSVLWKKDCLFFPYNAADNLITKNNKIYDLEALFGDLEGKNIKRASLPIPAHYTTDPQAEVIFTEKIDPSFFRYIYFSRKRNSMYVISAEDIIIENNKISSRKEKEYTKTQISLHQERTGNFGNK